MSGFSPLPDGANCGRAAGLVSSGRWIWRGEGLSFGDSLVIVRIRPAPENRGIGDAWRMRGTDSRAAKPRPLDTLEPRVDDALDVLSGEWFLKHV